MAAEFSAISGGAAACTELLKVIRETSTVLRSIRHASSELQEVTGHIKLLDYEVCLLERQIITNQDEPILDPTEQRELRRYYRIVLRQLRSIQCRLAREARTPTLKNKVLWGIHGKDLVKDILPKVTLIECNLNAVTQLIAIKLNQSHRDQLNRKFSTLFKILNNHKNPVSLHRSDGQDRNCIDSDQSRRTPIGHEVSFQATTQHLSIGNLQYTHHLSSDERDLLSSFTRFAKSLQIDTALASDDYVLANDPHTQQRLRTYQACRSYLEVPFTPGPVALYQSRIVGDNDPFIQACMIGDLQTVQDRIKLGVSSPFDRVRDNLPAIHFAVQSGSIRTVQLLLMCGVDVNMTYGHQDTTILQKACRWRNLEMLQFLIKSGANVLYRSRQGWTALFWLWLGDEPQSSCREILKFLSTLPNFKAMHHDVFDTSGYHIMSRVSAYGLADELAFLLDAGLSPFEHLRSVTKAPMCQQWYTIQLAIHHTNVSTFNLLLPHYVSMFGIDMADQQGWTLLHSAVERGNLDIVYSLLLHDARTDLRTSPTLGNNPNDDTGYCYTAYSLAAESGPAYQQEFGRMVKNVRGRSSDLQRQPAIRPPPAALRKRGPNTCISVLTDTLCDAQSPPLKRTKRFTITAREVPVTDT